MTNREPTPVSSAPLPQVMRGGYLFFLLLGAAITIYGPSLIYLAAETGQPVASLGLIFVLHWSGYFASTFVVNRIARRWGMRRSIALGTACVALGALGLAALPFPYNLVPTLLIGFGLGTEILFNRAVEYLAVKAPATALARLHATVGVGSVLMPLVVSGVIWLGLTWRVAALAAALLAGYVAIVVLRWREFEVPQSADLVWRAFPWRSVAIFVLMIVLQVGVETAVGGWVTTYFAQLGQGAFLGALATSGFFLTFTFGRIFLAAIPERWGYARTVQIGSVLALGGLLLTFSPAALAGFALAGIALSVIFPTLLAWVARRHPEMRAQMASVSIAAAGAGGVVIPYAVGVGVGGFGALALPVSLIVLILALGLLAFAEPQPKPSLGQTSAPDISPAP